MIIDCVSDLHGSFPKLEGGDLLIVAGDLTATDSFESYNEFGEWLDNQEYKEKVLIAGNHDGLLASEKAFDPFDPLIFGNYTYLCDSGCEFGGLKIWGSPYTPTFYNWSFMADRGEPIKKHWDLIPLDTDILITHGPPHGILDKTTDGDLVGCEELAIASLMRVRPRLHVFGHIHEGYGEEMEEGAHFVNCSIMNERYQPINKPIRVIL